MAGPRSWRGYGRTSPCSATPGRRLTEQQLESLRAIVQTAYAFQVELREAMWTGTLDESCACSFARLFRNTTMYQEFVYNREQSLNANSEPAPSPPCSLPAANLLEPSPAERA
ncbi:hypothetical protein CYMTET_15071 [Cymbomonas tetramitiformis]|uniref:Uncharacterized protein n=1 Tax=Cymbomonas tetramitiformis TaxID=36881 RepID=A0AAE0L9D2_9CHLO|nr:hypothetical protein CYMTET_15071 [Cymbomonas tetramitiformis]